MIKQIYNKFVQSIYSIQELQDVGVQCLFGQEELPSNITSGTILFYPDGGDSFSGPKTVGMNPSQLRTRKVGLALNIYTPVNDYDMQDILINYCVYALELTARSPQLVIEGGEYLGEMSEKDGLVVYKLNFSIDTVIHRPPLREVNITAVTDKTIDYIAGTVAH